LAARAFPEGSCILPVDFGSRFLFGSAYRMAPYSARIDMQGVGSEPEILEREW
jgi:hypothetical protein